MNDSPCRPRHHQKLRDEMELLLNDCATTIARNDHDFDGSEEEEQEGRKNRGNASKCTLPKSNHSFLPEDTSHSHSSLLFPVQLYSMLEAAPSLGFEDIVSWLPTGDGFRIHDRKRFQAYVIPRFFKTQTKYKSFLRQLNLYKFERSSTVKMDRGCYYRKTNFVRGKPELCRSIVRDSTTSTTNSKKLSSVVKGKNNSAKTTVHCTNIIDSLNAPAEGESMTSCVRSTTQTCILDRIIEDQQDEPERPPGAIVESSGGQLVLLAQDMTSGMEVKKQPSGGGASQKLPLSSVLKLLHPVSIHPELASEIISIFVCSSGLCAPPASIGRKIPN